MAITGLSKFGVVMNSNDSYVFNWYMALKAIDTFRVALSSTTKDQWFTDFASAVVSFRVYPFDMVKRGFASESASAITILGKETEISGHHMLTYTSYIIDMGELSVSNFDSYLYYSPFSHYRLYLPFVGWYDVDGTLIQNHTLSVKYLLDINTGNCVAYVLDENETVLYRFEGVCGINIPFSGSNRANISKMNAVNTVSYTGDALLGIYDVVAGLTKSSFGGTVTDRKQGASQVESGGKSFFKSTMNYITNTMSLPQLTAIRSGTSGDLSSFGEGFNCILVSDLCYPVTSIGYSHVQGRPLMKVKKLYELSGYTEVGTMHTDGIAATSAELDLIVSTMQEGVIL